jgi:hypothetical protein
MAAKSLSRSIRSATRGSCTEYTASDRSHCRNASASPSGASYVKFAVELGRSGWEGHMRFGRLALVAAAGLLTAAAGTVLAVAVNAATGGSVSWFPAIEQHPLRWTAGSTATVAAAGLLLWWAQRWYDAGRREAIPAVHHPEAWVAVSAWSAEQLNVHSAVSGQRVGAQGDFALPEYVPRPHDTFIREHLERLASGTETRLLLLRGGSCTGKTRTAYEAVRAALPDWRLAYPKTAEALLALLNNQSVPARSVVWLDDLHHLLDEPAGEDAAALLRDLLQKALPVALIATAWSDAYKRLITSPSSGRADRHYHARTLLGKALIIDIPDTFTDVDYRELERLASEDASLAAVIRSAGSTGAVAQTLAAAPELMDHWLHAPAPYGKAVITAAVDARRLGVRASLPDEFLKAAAIGYLSPDERAQAQPTWFNEALKYARQRIKRVTSALLPVSHPTDMEPLPGVSDLADYLEQQGDALRWDHVPPVAFWTAALDHLPSGDDLERLALNAFSRGRFRLSRDLNLAALRKGAASGFEGLCFSYVETGRIFTQPGRDELVCVVRDVEDGGYSLWYLGSTLWDIHGEPGGGGDETIAVAGELLDHSYQAGYLLAATNLAELLTAIGVDATGLIADARQKKAERAASSPQYTVDDLQPSLMTAPGADGSITQCHLA